MTIQNTDQKAIRYAAEKHADKLMHLSVRCTYILQLFRITNKKGSLHKYNLERQFEKLEPILLKEASLNDTLSIVRK